MKTEEYIIILIVAVVLNIAMFCKIWMMTNDVKSIKERLSSLEPNYYTKAKEYFLLGNKDKTKEFLDKSLLMAILEIHNKFGNQDRDEVLKSEIKKKYEKHKRRYEKANLDMPSIDIFLDSSSFI